MPYNGPGPRNSNELPKRKRKGNRKKQECIPMMMALLACYKANSYARLCLFPPVPLLFYEPERVPLACVECKSSQCHFCGCGS
jgi:hypothetical protein